MGTAAECAEPNALDQGLDRTAATEGPSAVITAWNASDEGATLTEGRSEGATSASKRSQASAAEAAGE